MTNTSVLYPELVAYETCTDNLLRQPLFKHIHYEIEKNNLNP